MAHKFPRQQSDVLICFAVEEEAKFFQPKGVEVLITGMGRRNAAENIRKALAVVQPQMVLTCGFAGGLNPDLKLGAIVYDEDFGVGLGKSLSGMGAVSGTFHCSKRVAVTAAEKNQLWQSTGNDAVEMESSVIRTICREFRIPSATVRVISDAANEDLPLDFNALMTSDDKINYPKLAWTVLSSPTKIPKLIEFQRKTILAARNLGNVLEQLTGAGIC